MCLIRLQRVPSKVLLGDLRKVLLDVVSSVWSNLFETNLLPGLPPPPPAAEARETDSK